MALTLLRLFAGPPKAMKLVCSYFLSDSRLVRLRESAVSLLFLPAGRVCIQSLMDNELREYRECGGELVRSACSSPHSRALPG